MMTQPLVVRYDECPVIFLIRDAEGVTLMPPDGFRDWVRAQFSHTGACARNSHIWVYDSKSTYAAGQPVVFYITMKNDGKMIVHVRTHHGPVLVEKDPFQVDIRI
ncbi:hypothetical protein [Thermoactinospora rubra]|uniref:hypothetical protein n=1 Tax=Thermoactinospora rubra TaxID=1088767 RepID=UPI000A1095AD|nr:hypothetical protein [Thermoactinospora rubra]